MHTFFQAYFWFMAAYLMVTLAALLYRPAKLADARISPAMWAEQLASHAFLIIGLVGVYGHLHALPILAPVFWQAFLVALGLFAALQHRMPKTRLLRKTHGTRAVVIASVVGVVLLVPMFLAVGRYGFGSPALWAQA